MIEKEYLTIIVNRLSEIDKIIYKLPMIQTTSLVKERAYMLHILEELVYHDKLNNCRAVPLTKNHFTVNKSCHSCASTKTCTWFKENAKYVCGGGIYDCIDYDEPKI
jgi:hypothetical protein